MEAAKPQRRWFQFSLRSLLVFFAVCAIAFVWLTPRMQRLLRQQKAIETITREGGVLYCDFRSEPFADLNDYHVWPIATMDGDPILTSSVIVEDDDPPHTASPSYSVPPKPDWWRAIFGYDDFAHVDFAFRVGPKGFACVDALPNLRILCAANLQVDRDTFSRLDGLRKLECLFLGYGGIDDAALEHLKNLTRLNTCRLRQPPSADRALCICEVWQISPCWT